MARCYSCEKEFHSCGSCGYVSDWEYDFCCYSCFETYLHKKSPYWTSILKKLTRDEITSLKSLLEEKEYGEDILIYAIQKLDSEYTQK